jgi:polyphenol oxidase
MHLTYSLRMWLTAPNLRSHGFSTCNGPQFSNNLSLRVGDDPETVLETRQRALEILGLVPERTMVLKQIHSADVLRITPESLRQSGNLEADAMVSTDSLALAIETADCYPLLFEDRTAGVIAAAHAGWRGTVACIARNTLLAMVELGANPARVQVAIGPGICAANYEVSSDLRERFLEAQFPDHIWTQRTNWHVDLAEANRWLLEHSGVPRDSIWVSGACSTEKHFFSYRRDAGITGRMWAVIAQ